MADKQETPEYGIVKKKLEELKAGGDIDIIFREHALERCDRRALDKDSLVSLLKHPEKLIRVDNQDEGKFKSWFQLSGRYSIVITLKFNNPNIYIITVYKTSKKWQKQAENPRR